MGVKEKLTEIQTELKAPKNLYNKFGQYKYRNAEGILEAVKPYLKKLNCSLVLHDEIVFIGNRFYVKSTAKLTDNDTGEFEEVSAYAREEETKKGMDGSQITGSSSSYARKYALNGLFLLDDTKDADTNEHRIETENKAKETKTKESVKSTPKQAKVNIVTEKCNTDNIDISKLCKLYNRKKIDDMTETQLDNTIKNWKQIQSMCKRVEQWN